MTGHMCKWCAFRRESVAGLNREIVHMARIIEKHPGTPKATSATTRIAVLKVQRDNARRILADHVAEVTA